MAKPNASELIEKIREARGNISAIARAYHVSRTSIYNWINAYETAKAELADQREQMVDTAESALYRQILEGDTTAIIFTLKTLGKNRGYVERVETKTLTWQDEVIDALRRGELTPETVREAYPDLAAEFFRRAGVNAD